MKACFMHKEGVHYAIKCGSCVLCNEYMTIEQVQRLKNNMHCSKGYDCANYCKRICGDCIGRNLFFGKE